MRIKLTYIFFFDSFIYVFKLHYFYVIFTLRKVKY